MVYIQTFSLVFIRSCLYTHTLFLVISFVWLIIAIFVFVYRLMLGFMLPTWFLSMWISNTATTAMMMPIVQEVLDKLQAIKKASIGMSKDFVYKHFNLFQSLYIYSWKDFGNLGIQPVMVTDWICRNAWYNIIVIAWDKVECNFIL